MTLANELDRAAELARLTDAELIMVWQSSSRKLDDPISHLIAREMIRRGIAM